MCTSARTPFTIDENHILEEGGLDQTVPTLCTPPGASPGSQPGGDRIERYSRKVFVGGLPPDIDEGEFAGKFPLYR